jgi:Glycosyl transferase family 2
MIRLRIKLHELFGPLYHVELPPELAPVYTVGLVITIYNRPGYLKRTLLSLSNSDLPDTVIMLIDDLSDDHATLDLVEHCSHPQAPVIKVKRVGFSEEYPRPATINQNLLFGWSFLASQFQTTYLSNLDADMIVRRDWMSRLRTTHLLLAEQCNQFILSGFNTPSHTVVETCPEYYRKRTFGGAHLFFHANELVEVAYAGTNLLVAKPSEAWDSVLIDYLISRAYRFYATRPSVTQHIGKDGINSKTFLYYDFAVDYHFARPGIGKVLWLLLRVSRTLFGIAFISVRRVKSMWSNKQRQRPAATDSA